MNKLYIFISILALSACATPSDVRKQNPMAFSSGKPSKQVAICISKKWAETKPTMALVSAPSNMQLTDDGYSISVNVTNSFGATWPVVIADISDEKSGSETHFYGATLGYGPYTDVVKSCQ